MDSPATCVVCGSDVFRKLFSHFDNAYFVNKKRFKLIECVSCGTATVANKPNHAELKKYYESNYYSYDTSSSLFFKLKGEWIKFWGKLPAKVSNRFLFMNLYTKVKGKGLKVLDVGCGDGSSLRALKTLGFSKLYGTEIDQKNCDKLNEKGITAYCTNDVTTLKVKDKTFDLIRMSHVLEHVYNPDETLSFLYKKLKLSGEFIMGVPNFHSTCSVLFGRHFCALQLPTHLFHFNKKSVKKILEKNGFKVKKIKTTGYSGFSYSLLNYIKHKTNRKELPFIVSLLFVFPLIPLDLLMNIIGRRYIINVRAVKV